MRKGKFGRNIRYFLYDRQVSGKRLAAFKKSFQEVQSLLKEGKKKDG